jgi:hypothetical protein
MVVMRYVVDASNIQRGSFREVAAPGEQDAFLAARDLSGAHRGVAFTVYRVCDGADAIATYLNGSLRFRAA